MGAGRAIYAILALEGFLIFGSISPVFHPSARADEPVREHELRTGGEVQLAVGAKGAASITLIPAEGHRIDAEAPLTVRIDVTPAVGLKVVKRRLVRTDAADPRAEAPRFELPLVAEAAGTYKLGIDVRFWLCAKKTCRPVHDHTEILVTVGAAAPTPAPAAPTGGPPTTTP